jgi:hypothetical protein
MIFCCVNEQSIFSLLFMIKEVFKPLIILLIITHTIKTEGQTINISFDMLECTHQCYNCKKTDKYFFALPSKIDYENKRNQSINDNRYSTEDQEHIFPLTVSIADKLTLENDEGVSRLKLPSMLWYGLCPMPPPVEPKNGCIKNYNNKHDLLHVSVFDKTCRIYNHNTNILKSKLDNEIENSKRIKLEVEQNKNEELIKQNALREKIKKIEVIFSKNIQPSFTKIKNKDTTGPKEFELGIMELSALWNHKIDLYQNFKVNDSLSFQFENLFKLWLLSYLYAGNYESGIQKIQFVTKKIPDFNNNYFNSILGLAYLMNCQSIKATETLLQWKPESIILCEEYNSTINAILEEMRTQHPELDCIKSIKTLPILAAISCVKAPNPQPATKTPQPVIRSIKSLLQKVLGL